MNWRLHYILEEFQQLQYGHMNMHYEEVLGRLYPWQGHQLLANERP